MFNLCACHPPATQSARGWHRVTGFSAFSGSKRCNHWRLTPLSYLWAKIIKLNHLLKFLLMSNKYPEGIPGWPSYVSTPHFRWWQPRLLSVVKELSSHKLPGVPPHKKNTRKKRLACHKCFKVILNIIYPHRNKNNENGHCRVITGSCMSPPPQLPQKGFRCPSVFINPLDSRVFHPLKKHVYSLETFSEGPRSRCVHWGARLLLKLLRENFLISCSHQIYTDFNKKCFGGFETFRPRLCPGSWNISYWDAAAPPAPRSSMKK